MTRLLFVLIIALFFCPAVSLANISTVTVRGEAELKVPADRANFELSVVTEADTPQAAMRENSLRAEKVLAALQRSGLEEKEISTGQFVVNPVWSQRPRQAPADWKPQIVGYEVTNLLRVKTLRIDQVGEFISEAVKAGSNQVNGLHFDLADHRQYRQEAIRIATERANEDARVLAVAAGTKLGKVISLNLDNARAKPRVVAMNRAYLAEDAMTPPVVPGEVTVHASVTAVYEIRK